MKTRAITGFFFVLVMLGSVLFGAYPFSIFFVVLALFSLAEFYRLIAGEEVQADGFAGMLLGGSAFVLVILNQLGILSLVYLILIIPFIVFIYIRALFRTTANPFLHISYTFFGIIYTIVPFLFFVALGFLHGTYQYHYPLAFLLLLWTNDTGAYLTGMKFGRHKLFERHSPKKTWEGFFGGMLLCIVVGAIISRYFTTVNLWQWLVIAGMIAVFGTLGDLTESMLKRSFRVKDSGSLLPGHGGLLDRFDGLLVAAPLVYLFLKLIFL